MWLGHLLFSLSWIFYFFLHSALATKTLKARISRLGLAPKYYRLFYNGVALAGLTALLLWQLNMSSPLLWKSPAIVKMFAFLVGLGGFVIMLICIKDYFPGLAGFRELYEGPQQNMLIRDGLHEAVRHPLYLGTLIFLWGLFFLFPYLSFFILNIILTGYTFIGIHFEEKKLVEIFGDQYGSYSQQVPRIIPDLRKLLKKWKT